MKSDRITVAGAGILGLWQALTLARRGHDRDGRKGLPIIVYGVMTDSEGCPVAVQAYRREKWGTSAA